MFSVAFCYPIVAVGGVLSHVYVFINGEWHLQAPVLFQLFCVLASLLVGLGVLAQPGSSLGGAQVALKVVLIYLSALFSSICVYRLLFHQLRRFPGPKLAAVTKLWHVFQNVPARNHIYLDDLYKRYGTFIRTGPNELTIVHPDALHVMNCVGSKCEKAVWYDLLLPDLSVNTTRNKVLHDSRRREWDQGFRSKALEGYYSTIVQYANYLRDQFANRSDRNEPINVSDWFYWFSFDIMGEFAFSRSFNMIQHERWHSVIIMLRKALRLLGTVSPAPWLAIIGFSLFPNTWVVGDWHRMLQWCRNCMTERLEIDQEKNDVSEWLIKASRERQTVEGDRRWLNGDAVTMIVAGSDTVAPTMVFMLYTLARHSECVNKLYDELRGVDIYDPKVLQTLPYLNGLINEVMRLYPPVPTGGNRLTPPEGLTVAGQYIPGGVTLMAPRYSIGKLESCFEQADKIIPERWFSAKDLIKEPNAFMPFSKGRYGCVGKPIALFEIRHLTALLVTDFHINFVGEDRGQSVERDMMDQFTAVPGKLKLMFHQRKKL